MSPIRQLASVREATTSTVRQVVTIVGTRSGWVGETVARPQTDSPHIADRIASIGELYARPRAYQHILEDASFDVEGWLGDEVGREFAAQEGVAFLIGDADNKPVGLLDGLTVGTASVANDETGDYQTLSTGLANSLGADADTVVAFLRQVVRSVGRGYRTGVVWMMNEDTHDALAELQDANGRDILTITTDGNRSLLLGYRVTINNDIDDIDGGVSATFPILFGNFRRAIQVVDRTGVSILRDPFTNPGSVMFYTRKRVGSMKLDANAVKVVTVPRT